MLLELHDVSKTYPDGTVAVADFSHVVPSHLGDRNLYPFETLQPDGRPRADGDRAFDDDEDEACGAPPAAAEAAPIRLQVRPATGGIP